MLRKSKLFITGSEIIKHASGYACKLLRELPGTFYNRTYAVLLFLIVLLTLPIILLPDSLHNRPYSQVLYSNDSHLLGAKIATDEQWRFPYTDQLPEKYKIAVLTFEDKRFYYHPGIDPIAVLRAAFQNFRQKKIVSGASTLSMQLIRLLHNNSKRTWTQKLYESYLTLGLELSHSKETILKLYAAHAPYGGNIVGLSAASWRYFGRTPQELSWAESAMLAVLPNSPSLIHPGKNQQLLKRKRDALLKKLHAEDIISDLDYTLSLGEPLPGKPLPLPRNGSHLLETLVQQHPEKILFNSTINNNFQNQAMEIVSRHHKHLSSRMIYNISVIIIDNETSQVVAYIGNSPNNNNDNSQTVFKNKGYQVDITRRPRSTGSILKPVLYAAMLNEGSITPDMLISDVPTNFAGYMPENFSRTYRGVVPAKEALALSLNIPAVAMLKDYRYPRFYRLLKKIGITSLKQPPDHYGLALILGGAESSLYEISSVYSSLVRIAVGKNPSKITVLTDTEPEEFTVPAITPGAAYLTLEALLEVRRPGVNEFWKSYLYSQKIAWKTGTSLGHRDAWAVGVTEKYTVGVWCGNAAGEAVTGMTGMAVASPLLFDLFSFLPKSEWIVSPYEDLKSVTVCSISGYLPTPQCNTKQILIPQSAIFDKQCPYHRLIHLDKSGKYRVTNKCESVNNMIHTPWLVLSPVQEFYYKKHNLSYQKMPPMREDCSGSAAYGEVQRISLIYPSANTKVFIPIDIDGEKSQIVLKAAHIEDTTIFWHIDDTYIESTLEFHEIAIQPEPGKHKLTLVDSSGFSLTRYFEVIDR
ncbi:MAG: penicillin-binding protein 1C [Spirochaetes bacterium]|nr:penicillin-binding protein 1C [Spirochaetota bacterium]